MGRPAATWSACLVGQVQYLLMPLQGLSLSSDKPLDDSIAALFPAGARLESLDLSWEEAECWVGQLSQLSSLRALHLDGSPDEDFLEGVLLAVASLPGLRKLSAGAGGRLLCEDVADLAAVLASRRPDVVLVNADDQNEEEECAERRYDLEFRKPRFGGYAYLMPCTLPGDFRPEDL
jgi:hypothetical protein